MQSFQKECDGTVIAIPSVHQLTVQLKDSGITSQYYLPYCIKIPCEYKNLSYIARDFLRRQFLGHEIHINTNRNYNIISRKLDNLELASSLVKRGLALFEPSAQMPKEFLGFRNEIMAYYNAAKGKNVGIHDANSRYLRLNRKILPTHYRIREPETHRQLVNAVLSCRTLLRFSVEYIHQNLILSGFLVPSYQRLDVRLLGYEIFKNEKETIDEISKKILNHTVSLVTYGYDFTSDCFLAELSSVQYTRFFNDLVSQNLLKKISLPILPEKIDAFLIDEKIAGVSSSLHYTEQKLKKKNSPGNDNRMKKNKMDFTILSVINELKKYPKIKKYDSRYIVTSVSDECTFSVREIDDFEVIIKGNHLEQIRLSGIEPMKTETIPYDDYSLIQCSGDKIKVREALRNLIIGQLVYLYIDEPKKNLNLNYKVCQAFILCKGPKDLFYIKLNDFVRESFKFLKYDFNTNNSSNFLKPIDAYNDVSKAGETDLLSLPSEFSSVSQFGFSDLEQLLRTNLASNSPENRTPSGTKQDKKILPENFEVSSALRTIKDYVPKDTLTQNTINMIPNQLYYSLLNKPTEGVIYEFLSPFGFRLFIPSLDVFIHVSVDILESAITSFMRLEFTPDKDDIQKFTHFFADTTPSFIGRSCVLTVTGYCDKILNLRGRISVNFYQLPRVLQDELAVNFSITRCVEERCPVPLDKVAEYDAPTKIDQENSSFVDIVHVLVALGCCALSPGKVLAKAFNSIFFQVRGDRDKKNADSNFYNDFGKIERLEKDPTFFELPPRQYLRKLLSCQRYAYENDLGIWVDLKDGEGVNFYHPSMMHSTTSSRYYYAFIDYCKDYVRIEDTKPERITVLSTIGDLGFSYISQKSSKVLLSSEGLHKEQLGKISEKLGELAQPLGGTFIYSGDILILRLNSTYKFLEGNESALSLDLYYRAVFVTHTKHQLFTMKLLDIFSTVIQVTRASLFVCDSCEKINTASPILYGRHIGVRVVEPRTGEQSNKNNKTSEWKWSNDKSDSKTINESDTCENISLGTSFLAWKELATTKGTVTIIPYLHSWKGILCGVFKDSFSKEDTPFSFQFILDDPNAFQPNFTFADLSQESLDALYDFTLKFIKRFTKSTSERKESAKTGREPSKLSKQKIISPKLDMENGSKKGVVEKKK